MAEKVMKIISFRKKDFEPRWSTKLHEWICCPSGSWKRDTPGLCAIPLADDFDVCPFKNNKSIAIGEFHLKFQLQKPNVAPAHAGPHNWETWSPPLYYTNTADLYKKEKLMHKMAASNLDGMINKPEDFHRQNGLQENQGGRKRKRDNLLPKKKKKKKKKSPAQPLIVEYFYTVSLSDYLEATFGEVKDGLVFFHSDFKNSVGPNLCFWDTWQERRYLWRGALESMTSKGVFTETGLTKRSSPQVKFNKAAFERALKDMTKYAKIYEPLRAKAENENEPVVPDAVEEIPQQMEDFPDLDLPEPYLPEPNLPVPPADFQDFQNAPVAPDAIEENPHELEDFPDPDLSEPNLEEPNLPEPAIENEEFRELELPEPEMFSEVDAGNFSLENGGGAPVAHDNIAQSDVEKSMQMQFQDILVKIRTNPQSITSHAVTIMSMLENGGDFVVKLLGRLDTEPFETMDKQLWFTILSAAGFPEYQSADPFISQLVGTIIICMVAESTSTRHHFGDKYGEIYHQKVKNEPRQICCADSDIWRHFFRRIGALANMVMIEAMDDNGEPLDKEDTLDDWISTSGMVCIVWAFENAELYHQDLFSLEKFAVGIDLRNDQILNCVATVFSEVAVDDIKAFIRYAHAAVDTTGVLIATTSIRNWNGICLRLVKSNLWYLSDLGGCGVWAGEDLESLLSKIHWRNISTTIKLFQCKISYARNNDI